MTKVEDSRMHWYLLGKCMLNAIKFPCLMVCSITMFGRLYQFCSRFFNNLSSDAFKITCNFTPQCNTIFHNKCQIHTSVLMSRAIHNKAISSWLFPDLYIVQKHLWRFGVLGITRLLDLFARVLIPGDGKQICVQFCCDTFLLRHLLTLKHSHH